MNPITAGLKKVSDGVASLANGRCDPDRNQTGAIPSFLANQQHRNADAPTTVLNPFTGKPLPYDNGTGRTSGASPALPSPNGGPNSGDVPARHEAPSKPGQYTKDIAIDVSDFQNGNGKAS